MVGSGGFTLPNWIQGYEQFWQGRTTDAAAAGNVEAEQRARLHVDNAAEFGEDIAEMTRRYQTSITELDGELVIDKVCDIFRQLNSIGVRLDVFDLMNALLKPRDLQIKQLWRSAAGRLGFVGTDKMNVYVLQVMSMLRQAYCSPKCLYFLLPWAQNPIRHPDGTRERRTLVTDSGDFVALWHRAVEALERATELLRHPQEFGVSSSKYLPFASILPAFAALETVLADRPAHLRFKGQRNVGQ